MAVGKAVSVAEPRPPVASPACLFKNIHIECEASRTLTSGGKVRKMKWCAGIPTESCLGSAEETCFRGGGNVYRMYRHRERYGPDQNLRKEDFI